MNILKSLHGINKDGKEVYKYTLTNDNGITATISEFGGAIISLEVPDKKGGYDDIVCGYDDLASYENADGYQGAIIGRVANRISNAHFTLDSVEYELYKNQAGKHHLHGGKVGFSHRIWNSDIKKDADSVSLILTLVSPDGDEGYPGELSLNVTYTLSNDNSLNIHYRATTTKRTLVNLTNHSYFNLAGYTKGKIYNTYMKAKADRFLESDPDLNPTGRILSVENTPFDFRDGKNIGQNIFDNDQNLIYAGGYDQCLVFEDGLNENDAKIYVSEPNSGRYMEVYTNSPAVHFYTGNFLTNQNYPFKGNYPQGKQNAFCLETGIMPDSINHEGFTNPVLSPDEEYNTYTKFKFGIIK